MPKYFAEATCFEAFKFPLKDGNYNCNIFCFLDPARHQHFGNEFLVMPVKLKKF